MRDSLHIVTCLSNPMNWQSRYRNLYNSLTNWLTDPHAEITLVECAYPDAPYRVPHKMESFCRSMDSRIHYIPVTAHTICWQKESLLNIGIMALPPEAMFVATLDGDISFQDPNYSAPIISALSWNYQAIQPWYKCLERGPIMEIRGTQWSYGYLHYLEVSPHSVEQEEPFNGHFIDLAAGKRLYGHPGYGWAWRRDLLDSDGLFDRAIVGGADRHMGLALLNTPVENLMQHLRQPYPRLLREWGDKRRQLGFRDLGYASLVIEHAYHGDKTDRKYKDRWDILVTHYYNPLVDVTYNEDHVIELAGNDPGLVADIEAYFQGRNEDSEGSPRIVATV